MCVEFDAIFIKSEFLWNGHISHDLVLWQAHLLVIQAIDRRKKTIPSNFNVKLQHNKALDELSSFLIIREKRVIIEGTLRITSIIIQRKHSSIYMFIDTISHQTGKFGPLFSR